MTDPPVWIARRAQPGVPIAGRSPAGACTTVARTVAVRATVPPWCPPQGPPPPGGPGTGPHRPVARRWVSSPAPPRAGST